MLKNPEVLIEGVTDFHYETGMEGSRWAVYDERPLTMVPTGYCRKCGSVIDELAAKNPTSQWYSRWHPRHKTRPTPPCSDKKHAPEMRKENSYDRLHILESGDHLTIYDKDNTRKILWEGFLDFKEFPVFQEHVLGMWIHNEQRGVERETWAKWFTESFPVSLLKAPED